jgi:metal-sulfur cluster biosynthetic enzyme
VRIGIPTQGGAIMVTEEQAREALKQVEDPELGLNIVDLGLVYDVEVEGSTINVRMTLTSPGCPVGPQLLNGSKMVLQELEGVEAVNVELVWEPFWSPDRINPDYRAILGL